MRHKQVRERLLLTVAIAAVYIFIDLPSRALQFGNFECFLGLKNFLPTVMGLLFGPYGAVGSSLGALFSAVLTRTEWPKVLLEMVCALLLSFGSWLMWYAGKAPRPVRLKKGRDYLRLTVILVLLSALCGGLSEMLLGSGMFIKVLFSYTVFGLLLGVPSIIILTSIVAVIPVFPPWFSVAADVAGTVSGGAEGLDTLNDAIDDFCLGAHINRKAVFGIQNCLEEFVLRIQQNCDDAPVQVRLFICDSTSMLLEYSGKRFNPLRKQKGEAQEELFGLLLIRQRALRAAYQYEHGLNSLHIVI